MRLPGGRYVRPGVNAWCKLVSVADGEVATDGRGAATLLLSHQTPAVLVPTIHRQDEQVSETVRPCSAPDGVPRAPLPDGAAQTEQESQMQPSPAADAQWSERYNTPGGKRLWFAWTPQYLAAWFNARHRVEELLDLDTSGYGNASWRGERTNSVAVDPTGERWADFGASARRPDGNPDTGDALELQARLTGETEGRKAETMRQAARELLQEAGRALEQAAQAGQPVPAWLTEILTETGRARYEQLAA